MRFKQVKEWTDHACKLGIPATKEMKYVIVKAGGKASAILFPKELIRSDFLVFCTVACGAEGGVKENLLSARFCRLSWYEGKLEVKVYGSSESLRKKLEAYDDALDCWNSHPGEDEAYIVSSLCTGVWDYNYPYEIKGG